MITESFQHVISGLPRQYQNQDRKTPEDFKKLAGKKGFLKNGKLPETVKAGQIVAWPKRILNSAMVMQWLFMLCSRG